MADQITAYNFLSTTGTSVSQMSFNYLVGQYIDSGSSLIGKVISKIECKMADARFFGGHATHNITLEIIGGGFIRSTSNAIDAENIADNPDPGNAAGPWTTCVFTFPTNTWPMASGDIIYFKYHFQTGSNDSSAVYLSDKQNLIASTHEAQFTTAGGWNHASNSWDVCMNVYESVAGGGPSGNREVGIAWRTSGGPSNANQYHAPWTPPSTLVQNSSNDLSMQVYVTLTGTPNHLYHPIYITGGNDYAAIYVSGPTAGLVGQRITKCTFRLSRVSTPTGMLYCKIRKGAGGADIVFGWGGTPGAGLDVSTLSLTSDPSAEYFFQNLDNGQTTGYPLQVGDRIILELLGGTSTSSAYVQVARTHTISTMPDVQMQLSSDGSTWATPSSGNDDVIGKVAVGGHTTPIIFPYHMLGYQNQRVLQKVTDTTVSEGNIHNKKITQVDVWLKRVGSATGSINAVIRNSAGNLISSINTFDAANVDNADFELVSFTNLSQSHTLTNNDRISIEYSGGDVSNHIQINTNLLNTYPYGVLETWNGTYTTQSGHDLAGMMHSGGGSTDPLARARIGEKIGTTNSAIKLKTISRIKVRMKKTSLPLGSVLFRIRNSADTIVQELGSKLASEIDPNTFTEYTITSSPIALYALQVGDIVSVEYNDNSSDQSNFVEVMTTKTTDGFGGPTDTYLVKYDDVNWISNNAIDLVGQMWEGGETFTPSQEDVILPSAVYTKDLTVLAGSTPWTYIDHVTSTFTHAPSQLYVNAIMPDFRFYRKVLTTSELLNIFTNRSDRGAIAFAEVTKIGFFSTTET